MACVVRYSFLLISICLRSISLANSILKVTDVTGAVGDEVIIQCATDKTPQDGVYMYKQTKGASKPEQIFYYYMDNTLTLKSKIKVSVDGTFPNLKVTFLNVNATDSGIYWCEFNLEEKNTVGTITSLLIEKQGEGDKNDAKIIPSLCAVIALQCIIILIFVSLKVKECPKNRPSNHPNQTTSDFL
ncbi:hypothetical protein QQF64_028814 [Cirrhinus molitorella]|uniref:Immunoglobulin domain-containing protein n=1 Tax=Cirrhinus molitorella TaxID=172907 RepID=A0ABR3N852_9TELE